MKRLLLLAVIAPVLIAGCIAHRDLTPDLQGIVRINTPGGGGGSGVVVGHRGAVYLVATCAHVVDVPVRATIQDVPVRVLSRNAILDVSILAWDAPAAQTVRTLAHARRGQWCCLAGYSALCRADDRRRTPMLMDGHVATRDRTTLYASCGAYYGCSGGPLLDADGGVLGLIRGFPVGRFGALGHLAQCVSSEVVELVLRGALLDAATRPAVLQGG